MDNGGITPVMNVGNGGYGYGNGFGFGDSGLFLFAILALMWGGNGLFGGNNLGYRPATAEDVNNGFNFADLQNQNRDIIASVERVGNGITGNVHDVAMNVAETRAQQQECCSNILRAIDATNYNTTAQVQKVLDTLSANKIDELQGKINQLELAQAVSGVVRYPTSYAYNAGPSPFCNCGFGNGNI